VYTCGVSSLMVWVFGCKVNSDVSSGVSSAEGNVSSGVSSEMWGVLFVWRDCDGRCCGSVGGVVLGGVLWQRLFWVGAVLMGWVGCVQVGVVRKLCDGRRCVDKLASNDGVWRS